MNRNRWLALGFASLVWTMLVAGTSYAVGADCPPQKAVVSDEMLTRLARFCLSACTACPEPCPQVVCPDCPVPEKCPDAEPEVLIVPAAYESYRLEALLLASEESHGVGLLWRPRHGRLRGVGLLYQRMDGEVLPGSQFNREWCSGLGDDPVCRSEGFRHPPVVVPDRGVWGVVATVGILR